MLPSACTPPLPSTVPASLRPQPSLSLSPWPPSPCKTLLHHPSPIRRLRLAGKPPIQPFHSLLSKFHCKDAYTISVCLFLTLTSLPIYRRVASTPGRKLPARFCSSCCLLLPQIPHAAPGLALAFMTEISLCMPSPNLARGILTRRAACNLYRQPGCVIEGLRAAARGQPIPPTFPITNTCWPADSSSL